MKSPQLFRFLVVAAGNTCVFALVIYICKLFGFSDVAANFWGYSAAITQSFLLNRTWTFAHGGKVESALLLYLAVIVVAYLVNLLILVSAIAIFGKDSFSPHALGALGYGIVAFFGMRYIVFKKKQQLHH